MNVPEREKLEEALKNKDIEIADRFLSWPERLLWRFFPRLALRYFIGKKAIPFAKLDTLHSLLQDTRRFDIIPYSPQETGARGFQLILDQKITLFFYQNGNSFAYDGYEVGEYEAGEVTLFDQVAPRR